MKENQVSMLILLALLVDFDAADHEMMLLWLWNLPGKDGVVLEWLHSFFSGRILSSFE